MKEGIKRALAIFIWIGAVLVLAIIGIYSYKISGDDKKEVYYPLSNYVVAVDLTSKKEISSEYLEAKLSKLAEDGYSYKRSRYTPASFTIDDATFIRDATGSLTSAYTTGYQGTISIPDAYVNAAALYRSSDQTLVDNDIMATTTLDWSGIFGVAGSTPIVCGHNNIGIFGHFGNLQVGSKIYIDTSYGQFIYQVSGFAIGDATDTNILFNGTDIVSWGLGGGNSMILYTCYPLNAYPAYQRYIVFADLVDGTELS